MHNPTPPIIGDDLGSHPKEPGLGIIVALWEVRGVLQCVKWSGVEGMDVREEWALRDP